MIAQTILIVDDDPATEAALHAPLRDAGLAVESGTDALAVIEKLRTRTYAAVLLDPMIHHRLNGYAVLNYIEQEQPETLSRVFVFSTMSKQTIARTAPALGARFFRKPSGLSQLADAIIAAAGVQPSPPRGSEGAVLLVEDDPVTAQALTTVLEGLGYSCHWVSDGGKVFEAMASSRFDAIVLDLVLPEVDGLTVLERMRSSKPHLLKRVVVTTGMPAKYLDHLDLDQICGIVPKPIDIAALQELLSSCIAVAGVVPGGAN